MRTCLAITLIFVSSLITGLAWAQYDHMGHHMEHMWNVRAGFFMPSGNTVDDSEFTIGIEHEHPADAIFRGMPGFLTLTVDWTEITTATPAGTDDVTLIPIIVNWKQHRMTETGKEWSYSIGAGVYWADDPIPDMDLDDSTTFAWQVMLGYHFNPSWFVEGRFLAGSDPGEDGLLGIGIGYTF